MSIAIIFGFSTKLLKRISLKSRLRQILRFILRLFATEKMLKTQTLLNINSMKFPIYSVVVHNFETTNYLSQKKKKNDCLQKTEDPRTDVQYSFRRVSKICKYTLPYKHGDEVISSGVPG